MSDCDFKGFGPFATSDSGIDMTIVWIYRNILIDNGTVNISEYDNKSNFDVLFYNKFGKAIASSSLPGNGTRLLHEI